MLNEQFTWSFKKLPFIWSELKTPDNGKDIPNVLPFELELDETNGVLTQKANVLVEKVLEKVYQKGSVVAGVIDEKTEDVSYANDFIDFFIDSIGNKKISNMNVLEIGSGTGYLLSKIQKLGANVIGVEPGSHCLSAYDKYNVHIINDFFPTQKIKSKYDVIIMSVVLEHFQNPSKFLKSLHNYIKNDGLVIVSVPDEEPFISSGDISTLFHEHYSYFSSKTLDNALKVGGFRPIYGRVGKYGGVLFRTSIRDDSVYVNKDEYNIGYELAINYKNKAAINNDKLKNFLIDIQKDNKTLGVYVPARFVNFLTVAGIEISKVRFFDDNPSIKGKFYPGFDIPIETIDDLIKTPTDIVLIFSKSFGKKIKENIDKKLPAITKIITWEELFEGNEK